MNMISNLIFILISVVGFMCVYSAGNLDNSSDHRVRRHVGIYRNKAFYCSAVYASKGIAVSSAHCGFYCGGIPIISKGTKQNPLKEYEAVFFGKTIEPFRHNNKHENGPVSMRTPTDLCSPDSYEHDPMEFVFPGGFGPTDLPDIMFANKSMLPYETTLTLFGYSALTGEPHNALEQSTILVVNPKSCQPAARKGEICAKYLDRHDICNADLGSPAYLDKNNQTYLVGVVTKQNHRRQERCTWEDTRLTLALLTPL